MYDFFVLQFSTDGVNFNELQRFKNTSLNTNEHYSYMHPVTAAKMYYRVMGQTLQGKQEYSQTVLLRSSDKPQLVRIYPNPVENYQVNVEM